MHYNRNRGKKLKLPLVKKAKISAHLLYSYYVNIIIS